MQRIISGDDCDQWNGDVCPVWPQQQIDSAKPLLVSPPTTTVILFVAGAKIATTLSAALLQLRSLPSIIMAAPIIDPCVLHSWVSAKHHGSETPGHWKWRMKNGLSGYSVGLLSITNSQQGRKGEKWNTSVNMYAWSWKKNLMVKTALAVAGVCSCDHLYPYRNSNRKPKLEFTWLQEQTRWTIAASNWEYIRWYFRRQHLLCHLSDKKWRIFIDHACICGAKYYFYLNAKCNPI